MIPFAIIFVGVLAVDSYLYSRGFDNSIFNKDKTHAELVMRTRMQFGEDTNRWPMYRINEIAKLRDEEAK
jgi:hypothetical protein